MQVSLVSWNVHGVPGAPRRSERMRAVAQRVDTLAPDVVLLQEVWLTRDAETVQRALAPRYRNLPHPGEGYWFRDSGLMALVRNGSAWSAGRSDLTEFRAEAPDWRLWEADGFADKGIQRVELTHQGTTRAHQGATLTLLNTHLQARTRADKYREVRSGQLAELAAVARASGRSGAVVCAGDLNTPAEGDLFAAAVAPSWLDLTAGLRGRCGCRTNFHDDGTPDDWIDYVLAWREAALPVVVQDMELLANRGPDDPYSDHNGFHARLRVGAPLHPASASPAALWLALLSVPERRWSRRALLAASLAPLLR